MTSFETFSTTTLCQLRRFCSDESGATAIEYAMIAAGVGACVAGTVWALGGKVKETLYDKIAEIFS